MGHLTTGSIENDEFSLIKKAKEGDEEALQRLLEHPVVQRGALIICQRIIRRNPKSGYYRDAEDLRQELFISFWQNLGKFRFEYGEASFWKFFEILARNIHLSHVRRSEREIKRAEEKSLDELDVASQEDQYFLLSIKEDILSQFNSLPSKARLAALEFIAILEGRYSQFHSVESTELRDLSKEPFVGMWQGRVDMQNSSDWVRKVRERE